MAYKKQELKHGTDTKGISMMIKKRDSRMTGTQKKQRVTSLGKNGRMEDFRGMSTEI